MKTMKKLTAILAFLAVAMTAFVGCGEEAADTKVASQPEAAVTESAKDESSKEEAPKEETTVAEVTEAEEEDEGFTLLDVDETMIEAGLYAKDDDGAEYVLSLFDYKGAKYCSMIVVDTDGSNDVVCGEYTGDSETDEDGITWSLLNFDDVYTDAKIEIGFAETDDKCYILDQEGNAYEAEYLEASETIDYMAAAIVVAEDTEETTEDDEDGFSLLDVDASMIETGLYAKDDDGAEYVLSMFKYDGAKYCSMIIVDTDGSGDVVCGEFEGATETDEDGITWSLLTFTDVYTEKEIEIGFAETDGKCYILDQEGNAYEAEYLKADETINYMAAAVSVASN